MKRHSCVNIAYLEARLNDAREYRKPPAFDLGEPGLAERLAERLAEWRAQGYEFVLTYDSVNERGHCAGHEEEP